MGLAAVGAFVALPLSTHAQSLKDGAIRSSSPSYGVETTLKFLTS